MIKRSMRIYAYAYSFLIAGVLCAPYVHSKYSENNANHEKKLRFFDSPKLKIDNDYITNPHPDNKDIPKTVSGVVGDIKKTHRDLHHIIQR